jgi:hypothetical protein
MTCVCISPIPPSAFGALGARRCADRARNIGRAFGAFGAITVPDRLYWRAGAFWMNRRYKKATTRLLQQFQSKTQAIRSKVPKSGSGLV